ncbi:MAG: hypothetical protein NTY35_04190 [Planctomycetota bacterium]|nr:hypothetical protein [Planctomycetota bacterium]
MGLPRTEHSSALPTAALADMLGTFELRDEDVVLAPAPGIGLEGSGPRTAACAGIDGDGRVVLALRARGRESVLAAIDALAWCDARGDLLARRLGADPELAPYVVLIVDEPDAETVAALATLRTDDLRMFEVRSLHSARGTEQDLAEFSCARSDADPLRRPAWDERLGAEARGFVDRVRAGIGRIDPAANPAAAARAIVWRRGNATLVTLRAPHGRLEAEVSGERFDVAAEADVERVLEGAVRALLEAREADDADPGERAESPRALLPTGPLLSEDELAALRGEG